MGTQKLLLPLWGKPVIAHVVDALLESPVHSVIVVTSRNSARVRTALAGRAVRFVENPARNADMLQSVRCGLRTLPANCRAVLVTPGDLPRLQPGLIQRMLEAFHATPMTILVPTFRGRHGHPLLFSARFRREILTSFDGTGLRGLKRAHPRQVLQWPARTSAILEDLDTPPDYDRMNTIV